MISIVPVSRLALGTVQFGLDYGIANRGGQIDLAAAREMIAFAADSGLDTLDTAVGYGEAETRLGAIGVDGFKVVTKLPSILEADGDLSVWVRGQIIRSCHRLGIKRLYGALLHRPLELAGPRGGELYRALLAVKGAGLVEKIGISVYAPDELDRLCPLFSFDLVQGPFNLIDRRLSDSGWLARLKDAGIEVHTRSAFLQGLLLMPRAAIPPQFARWSVLWDRWHAWLEEHRAEAVAACLGFPLSFTEVDRVVVGADNPGHLRQIVAAAGSRTADFPDLASRDLDLINPALWAKMERS